MATYTELFTLKNTEDLKQKVFVAAQLASYNIQQESTPVQAREDLAIELENAKSHHADVITKLVMKVLVINAGASTATILSATDAAILSNVETAIDSMVGAETP